MHDIETIHAAWGQIGRTPEGKIARALLVSMLMRGPTPGMSDGAVREEVGRLNLAREVLTLMDSASTDGPEHSASAAISRSAPVPGPRRGAGRRGVPG